MSQSHALDSRRSLTFAVGRAQRASHVQKRKAVTSDVTRRRSSSSKHGRLGQLLCDEGQEKKERERKEVRKDE